MTGASFVGEPEDFEFYTPALEVLEATVRHNNGDFTLRGPGGKKRLKEATPV